jgi:WD40 repeat protein
MKKRIGYLHRTGALIGAALLALTVGLGAIPAKADSLYIGDIADNTVKRFDAKTGAYLGTFVASGSGGLAGPNGIIFVQNKLDVVNQNVNTIFNGNVLQYSGDYGAFLGPLFSDTDPNAPFDPRGIIRGSSQTVYVADLGNLPAEGKVSRFDDNTGKFLGNLDTTGFGHPFYPRGVVFGPDGLFYVSATGDLSAPDPTTGYILRFNPKNGKFLDVFTSNLAGGCATGLHRPEGLTFGPDGNLYAIGFRNDATDTDKILVFDGHTGKCLDNKTIVLDQVGGDRAVGQALIFGPGGRLFVPIEQTGGVRRYNVVTKTFDDFVLGGSSSPLGFPFYLTFGATDPRTLAYGD